jgi:hypothetical protein
MIFPVMFLSAYGCDKRIFTDKRTFQYNEAWTKENYKMGAD